MVESGRRAIRRGRPLRAAGAALLLVCAAGAALSKDAPSAVADPVLEAKMLHIAAELRCLVCQNQTLADSDANLAQDLREQIRTMLRQGANETEVRRFMTDRYGDFVLYRPPLKAITLALWLGPAALLGAGLLLLFAVLRQRARLGDAHFDADPPDAAQTHDAADAPDPSPRSPDEPARSELRAQPGASR